jgi:HAE1 family hydrophobic/amphiphilic exporter-1
VAGGDRSAGEHGDQQVHGGDPRGPAGNAIEVEIQGADLARVEEVSKRIQAWFAEYPGVFDLGDDLDPGGEQVRVRLREGAGAAGLNGAALAQQVRAALSGVSIQTFHAHGETYELFVELERRSRDSLADLEYFPVTVAPGVTVPLGALARIDVLHGYARINRSDGARTVTVTGGLDPEVANAAELMARFEAELAPALEREYPELRLAVGGARSSRPRCSARWARACWSVCSASMCCSACSFAVGSRPSWSCWRSPSPSSAWSGGTC